MALVANTFGSEISDAERAQFRAAAEREKAGGRKKGGVIKAKPKTKIQHKGMSSNLKKMLGK
jgi:hypothetical protein